MSHFYKQLEEAQINELAVPAGGMAAARAGANLGAATGIGARTGAGLANAAMGAAKFAGNVKNVFGQMKQAYQKATGALQGLNPQQQQLVNQISANPNGPYASLIVVLQTAQSDPQFASMVKSMLGGIQTPGAQK
jgi:hypothetical protein